MKNDNNIPNLNYYEEPIEEIDSSEDELIAQPSGFEKTLSVANQIMDEWNNLSRDEQDKLITEQEKYVEEYEAYREAIEVFAYNQLEKLWPEINDDSSKYSALRLSVAGLSYEFVLLDNTLKELKL